MLSGFPGQAGSLFAFSILGYAPLAESVEPVPEPEFDIGSDYMEEKRRRKRVREEEEMMAVMLTLLA